MKVEVQGPIGRLEFSLLCARVWEETRSSVCHLFASPKTMRRINREFIDACAPFWIWTGEEAVKARDLDMPHMQHIYNPICGNTVYLEEATYLPDSAVVAARPGISCAQGALHSLVAIPPGAS